MKFTANIIDLHRRRIFHGEISIENGIVQSIQETPGTSNDYIMPGFVDAHVHIESSMLVPSEFARMATVHGTVGTVSDPHEIANVMGVEGVRFMMENGGRVPFKFHFGAPSCVPATGFETAGAVMDSQVVEELLKDPKIYYLTEMMNYPGVLFNDGEVMKKIAAAHRIGKPIDGHAPGVTGDDAKKYFAAGITTDHECFTYEEGLEKARLGVKILIREGSAAKNFDALIPLLKEFPAQVMFCSDDKHPDDLALGHINQLAARALRSGCELFDVLCAACLHPVEHYGLPVGTLKVGDPADFIITDDLQQFTVKQTWINGQLVAENGRSLISSIPCEPINQFNISTKKASAFAIPVNRQPPTVNHPPSTVKVIRALDGQLVTESFTASPKIENGFAVSDMERDFLKFTVVNRYQEAPPALAFMQNFNLKNGAIASCVGHDSHNILAIGTDDSLLCRAVNLIIENKGGISAVGPNEEQVLPLPVAGIMTTEDGYGVAKKYAAIDAFVKEKLGSTLAAPFMTLSFMALLVIPELKLSDKGLFDGKAFKFVELFGEGA
ncbi:MAG TPA: adenine deaminase [Bacteroidetes bacterium]|nr:adenine deaminase [Bacteroidota bacterium]